MNVIKPVGIIIAEIVQFNHVNQRSQRQYLVAYDFEGERFMEVIDSEKVTIDGDEYNVPSELRDGHIFVWPGSMIENGYRREWGG